MSLEDGGGGSISLQTINIQPKNVFGLRRDVKGNINFTAKQEVIYPVAGVLSVHDYNTNKQKFLRFAEKSIPTIIAMSANRKMLAVAEKFKNAWINIYDMATLKKRRTLNFPNEVPTKEPESIEFTYDCKGLVVLSKEPDAFLTIFYFDKSDTIVCGRVSNSSQKALSAKYIACNHSDNGLVAVAGDFTFKFMSRQEKGFSIIGTVTGENKIVTSLVFLSAELLVAGTSTGQLLFVEGGDPKTTYNAETTDVIDLNQLKEDEPVSDEKSKLMHQMSSQSLLNQKDRKDVNCLTQFSKGFIYSIHNSLYVFEKESSFRYAKKTFITIPIDLYPTALYRITNVAVNSQMDTVIVTAKHNQIYISMLVVPQTLKMRKLEFKTLGEPLHLDGIVGMTVCSWKPIVMTAGKDQTIRVWNYETGKVELVKKYQVDITSIALHPSGIFLAIGFNDQMRLMEILLEDLKVTKTFNFPKCKDIQFSHQGHILACAYDDLISIVFVFSFETVRTLKGHNGLVLSLAWSSNDKFLVSSGEKGAVYQWGIDTGERVNECVQKGTEYRSVALTKDLASTFTVTQNGLIREMGNSEIIREVKVQDRVPLTCIALSRSDLVMFAGSEHGQLFNVQIPFLDTGGSACTNYRFFSSSITKMKITFNDMLLATGSADGTLVIWSILNNHGRVAAMDPDLGKCIDVMIPRPDLLDKIDTIKSLEQRIEQQIAEFQYQMKQGQASHSDQMRDIHEGYCKAIEDLKSRNLQMEAQHIEEFNIITDNIGQMKDEQAKALMDLETDFHSKIIIEFEKSASIKKKMDDMREDYEIKLRKSAGCLQDTIEALETDFKKQLHERQELIRQLLGEKNSKESEFVEYCRQVEIDHERKLVETQLSYEKKLKQENDAVVKWSADAGVLNKKFKSVSKYCDELEKEKDVLRAEHYKTLTVIQNYQKDIEELRKEIEDRDITIRDKEKRVNELTKKNQELEKYKQVLNHKIADLKSQTEPREREIKEKKDEIADMEKELEALELNNSQLELRISELKDKYFATEKELKIERTRCRNSRSQVTRMCGDIYHVSSFVQLPVELKKEVMLLYHRYADDKSLKESLELDAEVENEFLRQRNHLEQMLEHEKKAEKRKETGSNDKMIKENVKLLAELNKLRTELKESQKKNFNMESILGISSKYLPTAVAREKLEKACANFDELHDNFKAEQAKLNEIIETLVKENDTLRSCRERTCDN